MRRPKFYEIQLSSYLQPSSVSEAIDRLELWSFVKETLLGLAAVCVVIVAVTGALIAFT